MANKITETKNGVTSVLLDVSQTTATEADVAQGKVFTKQDGTQGTGTLVQKTYETWDGSYTDLGGYEITLNVYFDGGVGVSNLFFNDEQISTTPHTQYNTVYSLYTVTKKVNGPFTFSFWSGMCIITDARYAVDGSIPFDKGSGVDFIIQQYGDHDTQEVSIQPTDDMTINVVLAGYVD